MLSPRTLDIRRKPNLIPGRERTAVPCLRYLATLSRLVGICCDTASTFRHGRPASLLKTLKLAIHTQRIIPSVIYTMPHLEPPRTDMEERSTDTISKVYAASIKMTLILIYPSTATKVPLIVG